MDRTTILYFGDKVLNKILGLVVGLIAFWWSERKKLNKLLEKLKKNVFNPSRLRNDDCESLVQIMNLRMLLFISLKSFFFLRRAQTKDEFKEYPFFVSVGLLQVKKLLKKVNSKNHG